MGFYRGAIPPFFGSVLYRSLQFSVYESFFTKASEIDWMNETIPGTSGLTYKVLLAALTASSSRAFLECPFEYAKVKGQTGQAWKMREIYKGFSNLYPRTVGLMTTYFILVDTIRRKTNLWDYKIGQFFVSGGSALFGFVVIWPLEVLKNLA